MTKIACWGGPYDGQEVEDTGQQVHRVPVLRNEPLVLRMKEVEDMTTAELNDAMTFDVGLYERRTRRRDGRQYLVWTKLNEKR